MHTHDDSQVTCIDWYDTRTCYTTIDALSCSAFVCYRCPILRLGRTVYTHTHPRRPNSNRRAQSSTYTLLRCILCCPTSSRQPPPFRPKTFAGSLTRNLALSACDTRPSASDDLVIAYLDRHRLTAETSVGTRPLIPLWFGEDVVPPCILRLAGG